MARKNIFNKKSVLIPAVIILLAILVWGSHAFYQSHKRLSDPLIPSKPEQTSKQVSNSDSLKQPSAITGSNTTPANANSSTTNSAEPAPQAPFGSFVSTHKADGSTLEQSVCNTTPGAQCYIQFTKDGTTKKLTSQVVDSNGTTVWNWSVKDAGLSAGSWQITAVASLNGQTKSTTDPIKLEVS